MSFSGEKKYFYSSRNFQVFRRFQNSCLFIPKIYAAETENTTNFIENYKERIKAEMDKDTGPERLKKMFSYNEFGYMSPELIYIVKNSYICAAVCAIVGGYKNARLARDDFFRKNVATPFESQFRARRQLTDQMTISGIKGAFHSGMKFGSFSFVYLFLTTTSSTYNNKITIWDHVGSGAIVGGLFKFNFGLKGMAVGSVLGAVLGLIAGSSITLSMKMSGLTYSDLRFYQHEKYWKDYYGKLQMEKKTEDL